MNKVYFRIMSKNILTAAPLFSFTQAACIHGMYEKSSGVNKDGTLRGK